MAGKKASGKNYTSKGERRSVSKKNSGQSAHRNRHPLDVALAKMKALSQGRAVVETIENPNAKETNKRFIRKRVNPQKRRMYETPVKEA